METTFLYSVNPKKVIKELPTLPIRAPKSLYLTKDQVKICLKYGSVYRRFANEQRNERVTVSNIDRLHNEKFMTEEQYENYKDSLISDNRGSVIQAPEEKPEQPAETKVEDVKDEVKEDPVTPVVETPVQDTVVENTEVNNEVQENENPVVETPVEEVATTELPVETKVEDEVKEDPKNNDSNKNNYGGKNNKHRK